MMHKKQRKQNKMSSILKGLNELNNDTLASYKKKAGADATAADKEGDTKKADKRFSGIVKATKKQFTNDGKDIKENTNFDKPVSLSKFDKLGFSVRSTYLWPAELFETKHPETSEDLGNWLDTTRTQAEKPKENSDCILALILHTFDQIVVWYGIAKYIGETETHYILQIPSGEHEYSKDYQVVFKSQKEFDHFITILTLKYQDADTNIKVEKIEVQESNTIDWITKNKPGNNDITKTKDHNKEKVGMKETTNKYHANRTGFSRGPRDDERHDLDVQQTSTQVWGLKIKGKVWNKNGKDVTFTSQEAATKSMNSILKMHPDLQGKIGLVTKGSKQSVSEAESNREMWDRVRSKGTVPGIDREKYTERPGLEGPFSTKSGKVVYYDKQEGKYYDPSTDFYISHDDYQAMNEQSVTEAENYQGHFKSKEDAVAYAKESVKRFRDPEDGVEIWALPGGGFDTVHTMNSNGRNHCIDNGGKKLGTIGSRYPGVTEGADLAWDDPDLVQARKIIAARNANKKPAPKVNPVKPKEKQTGNPGVTESAQRVDSLVTDALKIMRGSELNDAVQALKTVLGNREYNDRRGHYNFYVKQLLDMYGQQGVAEEIDSRFRKTEWIPIADALKILKHYGATIEEWGGHFHFAYYDREGVRKRIEDLTWNADDTRNVRLSILNQAVRELKAQKQGVTEEQRLDPKCWKGYKKQGTKMKGDTRVNNCVPVSESSIMQGINHLDEGWKEKLGAAALTGAMALGGGAASGRVTYDAGGNQVGGLKPNATVQAEPAPATPSTATIPGQGLVRAERADRQAGTVTVDGQEYKMIMLEPGGIRPRGGQQIVIPQAVMGERGIGNYMAILAGNRVFVLPRNE